MKRKIVAILIGLLALSAVVGIGLAQAQRGDGEQSVEQGEDEAHENESFGTDDGEEPGDVEEPGNEVEDD
jgi:hypothetical protein